MVFLNTDHPGAWYVSDINHLRRGLTGGGVRYPGGSIEPTMQRRYRQSKIDLDSAGSNYVRTLRKEAEHELGDGGEGQLREHKKLWETLSTVLGKRKMDSSVPRFVRETRTGHVKELRREQCGKPVYIQTPHKRESYSKISVLLAPEAGSVIK